MASRREEKERLRAARVAAEAARSSSGRRRLIAGYIVAGILTAAVIGGLIAVIASSGGGESQSAGPDNAHVQVASGTIPKDVRFDDREGTPPPPIAVGDLEAATKAAGCDARLDLPDEGNSHIETGDPAPKYKTNPPASGNHITSPLQTPDGAYLSTPERVNYVHSLEHGRVEIHYSPKLPEDEQLAIKGVFDESPDGMLMFPDPLMPYAVAVTAWTQLVGCPEYTPEVLDVIRDFRDTYRGNGPEGQVPVSL